MASITAVLGRETGTLGVRGHRLERWTLPRHHERVLVDDLSVRVKVSPGRAKAEYDDAAVQVWENVLFADNFYQRLNVFFGLDPMGNAVAGAYNRRLLNLNGANASAHSDVHLWYHGTIALGTPAKAPESNPAASDRAIS